MSKKIFLIGEERDLFVDDDKDVNTEYGIIRSTQLKKAKKGAIIKTHKGNRFIAAEPMLPDLMKRIVRLPQIITLKDLGSIIVYGGIGETSKVLDVGTGSGVAACVIGSIAKKGVVVSYEIRKDFIRAAKKNIKLFGLENVKIINKDIKKGIKGRNFDFALIDVADPWDLIQNISKSVRVGGRICCYSPSIIQVEKTLRAAPDNLKAERLIQNNEINWKVDIKRDILRPESSGIMHTGFLLFFLKTRD